MDASEDMAANLRNYEIQLQQVLAALGGDDDGEASADREELLKLKVDLEEVIKLTKDLMTSGTSKPASRVSKTTNFKAGDKVFAPLSIDGLYYEAILEELMSDGQCSVTFCDPDLGPSQEEEGTSRKRKKGISEVCLVSLLKPCSSADGGSSNYKKHKAATGGATGSSSQDDKSHGGKALSREDLRKKQQKRALKVKELEDEREKEKSKWQQFNTFGSKKGKKKGLSAADGKQRVSIFASPESVEGRVGIGTCGISGKPTKYTPTTSIPTNNSVALHHSSFQKKKQLQAGFGAKK